MPEFIVHTVLAIQKIDNPGDDFEEPTQEPPH